MQSSRAALLLAAGAVSACSLAPAYRVPDSVPSTAAYAAADAWQPAEPRDGAPRGSWWTVFEDPTLDALEARAGAGNQDLRAAYARLAAARATTRIARAAYWPGITAAAAANRSRASTNSPNFPRGAAPIGNNFDLEADFSYELDLWGRVRSGATAARASEQASAADLATLDLALHAELAIEYFALRAADSEQALLDRTAVADDKALELTRNLYRGGGAALADVAEAEAALEAVRTQAADVALQRDQLEHAIAVLIGENASAYRLPVSPLDIARTFPAIDPGLPSQLLERRPDVAAAERRVAAANASIGVARAAYFPVFSLAAAVGQDSTSAANWLDAPSRLWSLGPAAVLTVFDAGRHHALVNQAQATYDEQVADYRQAVLGAYRDVEDQLSALRQLAQESTSQAAAVRASRTALEQAEYRYRAGAATFLEVVVTENAALQAETTAVSIAVRRLTASVLLIEALGGGWQTSSTAPAPAVPP
jgi:NodT family efflux transporter outer membrane factor (OMF) lipoprotein